MAEMASTPRQRRPPEVDAAQAALELPPLASPFRQQGQPQHIPVRPFNSSARARRSVKHQHHHHRHHTSHKAHDKKKKSTAQLLFLDSESHIGWMSPWAWLWGTIFLSIPAAYVYIALVLLRELCRAVPTIENVVQVYIPPLAYVLRGMAAVSWVVEAWCIIEALFYVTLRIHFRWLQTRDTLEASLSAAPLMDLTSRRVLWQRMMETEAADTAAWIRGWLLDADRDAPPNVDLQQVSMQDMRGFLCWSMFEGRRTEHLTPAEADQLESFLEEIQGRLSLQFYGSNENEDGYDDSDGHWEDLPANTCDSGYDPWKVPRLLDLPTPKQGAPNEEKDTKLPWISVLCFLLLTRKCLHLFL